MSAPASGLARVTIRTPQRRLDLAVPCQVPLAELLPEVLYRAGEDLDSGGPQLSGGWILRRGDGDGLAGDRGLVDQGVRDGDVLYLVPRHLTWPEPDYDDVIEEIAAAARAHGRAWDAAATRVFALAVAGLVVLAGLGALAAVGPSRVVPGLVAVVVAVSLLAAGAMISRALGDQIVGAAAGGFALPFALLAGVLVLAGDAPSVQLGADQVLVGAAALLFASAIGAAAVGHGLRIFAAGATIALLTLGGAVVGYLVPASGAAAVTLFAAVAAAGFATALVVRLGGLPLPVVSADPEAIAGEERPTRPVLIATTARADDLLSGILLGVAIMATGCVARLTVLAGSDPGVAGPLLGAMAAAALLLRARHFPNVAARLPLLIAGVIGLALTGAVWALAAGAAVRVAFVILALATLVALLGTATSAPRRPGGVSPYLGRAGDLIDLVALLALAPVVLQVLDLYSYIRGLVS